MLDAGVLAQRARGEARSATKSWRSSLPVRVAIVGDRVAPTGTRLSERVTAVGGTPRNPMPRAVVMEKARDLHRAGAGEEQRGSA